VFFRREASGDVVLHERMLPELHLGKVGDEQK
jgi:hypothetical protein